MYWNSNKSWFVDRCVYTQVKLGHSTASDLHLNLWTRFTAIGLVFSYKTQNLDWLVEPKRAKFFKSSLLLWDKVTVVVLQKRASEDPD